MISYNHTADGVTVKLEGKVVGHIRQLKNSVNFAYFPSGSKAHGAALPSVNYVKRTLEAE